MRSDGNGEKRSALAPEDAFARMSRCVRGPGCPRTTQGLGRSRKLSARPRSLYCRDMPFARVGLILMGLTGIIMFGASYGSAEAVATKKVVAYVAWWDQARGIAGVKKDIDLLSSVSPVWYVLDRSGAILPYRNAQGQSYVDPAFVGFVQASDVQLMPVIQNATSNGWDGQLVRDVISDPTKRAAHISHIVSLVDSQGYDGIDIDYESLLATDRAAYTLFITELAGALHARGKLLAVSVHPKTSEPGTWDGPQAQDWAAIGAVADEVRIMVYGYSWQSSVPGSISPIAWVNQVLAFARTAIPAEKIIHGVPTYGIDWPQSGAGTEHMWDVLMARLSTFGATLRWDATTETPWFQYVSAGTMHTVWFENASSTSAKLNATVANGAAGISVWRLGGEDPAMWPVIRATFGSNGGAMPLADIKANGSDALTVSPGDAATISWSSSNATTCNVAPAGWSGLSNSSISTGPLATSTIYTLTCTNAYGSATDAVTITVTDADSVPPAVTITSPADGATIARRVVVSASATDAAGVSRVRFYVDGSLIATDTSAPYSAAWNATKAANGWHEIRVEADDVAGNTGSAAISVRK